MEKTIYVNPPASRTWNCLGVNEAAVHWDTDAEALLSNERFTAVSGENAPLRIEAADGGAAYGRRVYTVTAEAGAELTVFEVCTAAQPLAAELRLTAAEGAHLRVVQLLNPAQGAVLRHELSAQLAEHREARPYLPPARRRRCLRRPSDCPCRRRRGAARRPRLPRPPERHGGH